MQFRDASPIRPQVLALGVAVAAAIVISVFDLGTSASASSGIDEDKAVAAAREQGFEGDVVEAQTRYDRIERRVVWDVRGAAEHAVIDAETGELLALSF